MKKLLTKILPIMMIFIPILNAEEKTIKVIKKRSKADAISVASFAFLTGTLITSMVIIPNHFTNRELDRLLALRGRADFLKLSIDIISPGEEINIQRGRTEKEIMQEIELLEKLKKLVVDERRFVKKVIKNKEKN